MRCIDHEGEDTTAIPRSETETDGVMTMNTFFMERCGKENKLSNEELWDWVQETRSVPKELRTSIPFVDPMSDMEMRVCDFVPPVPTDDIYRALNDIVTTIEYRSAAPPPPAASWIERKTQVSTRAKKGERSIGHKQKELLASFVALAWLLVSVVGQL